jgi:3-oxoacyl-[acyl-carrier-protein] synthase II
LGTHKTEVVLTGLGLVSPIGVGREDVWAALSAGRSGVARFEPALPQALPVKIAAQVRGFDPKAYVANRKSLKVMSRDAQLGVAAAALARRDAGLAPGGVDPGRFGIVFGADTIYAPIEESASGYRTCIVDGRFDFNLWGTKAMAASYPLGFLRVLPNMIASHISIAQDARGPNNTIHEGEVSSLLAIREAADVIRRGAADVMLAGGASSQMHPSDWARRAVTGILSPRQDEPAAVVRPFDLARDGQVWGEGAAVFVLESRRHAEARGARIAARLLACAATCEPVTDGTPQGRGLRRAISLALEMARISSRELSHVNAHGLSTVRDDALEARAIRDTLGSVPVTAPKSYFGNLGAAGAAMELAVSALALEKGSVPPTLNYERPDPDCPIEVIHGAALSCPANPALAVTWMAAGQAAAVVLGGTN